jgi:hypothetical protein
MAVQIRRLSARNDVAGNAIVSVGFVLVAHDTGRALHTPLPDDEDQRGGTFSYDSSCTRR